jgi:hypothetical protein
MGMAEVKIRAKRRRSQGNGLPGRVDPVCSDVRTTGHEHWVMKQVIGSAIFLKDDHYVLDLSWNSTARITATAAAPI